MKLGDALGPRVLRKFLGRLTYVFLYHYLMLFGTPVWNTPVLIKSFTLSLNDESWLLTNYITGVLLERTPRNRRIGFRDFLLPIGRLRQPTLCTT